MLILLGNSLSSRIIYEYFEAQMYKIIIYINPPLTDHFSIQNIVTNPSSQESNFTDFHKSFDSCFTNFVNFDITLLKFATLNF